jgi:hypothetical protein
MFNCLKLKFQQLFFEDLLLLFVILLLITTWTLNIITVEIIHTLTLIYWQNSNVVSAFHSKMAAEEVVFRDKICTLLKKRY